MNGPINNTFINETVHLNKNIKLETEQDNVAEMICFFLPHQMTETDTSSEHEVDLLQLKEEPLDINNGNIEKDPLAIEETSAVKSENFKVENKVESEISLNDEVSSQLNCNIKTSELQIHDKYLHTVKIEEEIGFYQSHVTIDKGTIKESTKNCITCKRHVNNSLRDGVIKEKSIESSFKNVSYCTPLTLVTAQPFDDFIWKITILMSQL
ncbi:uncharacterized protein LOC142333836 isoform X2 [Lycorma delicatula]|uniref:uncharacterized protein LOC142333836 isoform X2 n=1 Tax=Lycorma delicatula TaxID=130591 RepID=UPI003F5185AE